MTVAVTITADDTLILSTLVFKGKPNGRIATKEFPSGVYPASHFYKCQENAWMDEEVMIAWVNKVLAPYVATAPDHVSHSRSDPRQRAKLFGTRGRGMVMIGSSTTWGNKLWVGTKMGPSKLLKSLSHIVSLHGQCDQVVRPTLRVAEVGGSCPCETQLLE